LQGPATAATLESTRRSEFPGALIERPPSRAPARATNAVNPTTPHFHGGQDPSDRDGEAAAICVAGCLRICVTYWGSGAVQQADLRARWVSSPLLQLSNELLGRDDQQAKDQRGPPQEITPAASLTASFKLSPQVVSGMTAGASPSQRTPEDATPVMINTMPGGTHESLRQGH